MTQDKDNKTKGVDSHKDYMQVVKSVLWRVLAPAVEYDQSVRVSAT
jgi:hypothetical protein